ncbi:MAG: DUF1223 domain-containing protein [Halieaceae bacterium]
MTPRLLPLLFMVFAAPVLAEQSWQSGNSQGVLLELYTSEGCSSCPPADRWLSGLTQHPDLWLSVFPIAFHVDYWNYLGWEDRFASSQAGKRQRLYRVQGNVNGVYTPGVIAAGQEWRSWRRNPTALPQGAGSVGALNLVESEGAFSASFTSVVQVGEVTLNVAVLGFGMKTEVRAGENRGEELRHDFVVLGHSAFENQGLEWRGRLPDAPLSAEAERVAVVAWVSAVDRLTPIQVVGGWLSNEDR